MESPVESLLAPWPAEGTLWLTRTYSGSIGCIRPGFFGDNSTSKLILDRNVMPKPQGTFLRSQANAKSAATADKDKKAVATSKEKEREKFYELLDRISESRLKTWQRDMTKLLSAIKKSEPISKEDKVRRAVSDVIGEVRKILTNVKDHRALEATLQRPAETVVRAPTNLGAGGAELALMIALCQVLEILVKIRGNKSKRE